jgi:RNA polymerase sigma-32 factor
MRSSIPQHRGKPSAAKQTGLIGAMGETGRGAGRAIRDQLDWANLAAARERELLLTVQSTENEGDRQAALTELWESHSKLVVAIAGRYRQTGIEFLDLVGAGHLGLHAAIARFDPQRYDSRLSTYAIGWIRWHIQDYLRRNAAPVRLPASSAHRQLARMEARLFADARRSCERERVAPTEGELCERIGRRIGLSGDEVASSLQLIRGGSISLHGRQTPDGNETAGLAETLADGNAASEDDVILRLDHAKARKRIISLAEEILGERERMVFLARCMTDSDDVVHLAALASQLGVSPERVYQLEASAKRKIATALAQEGYADVFQNGQPIRLPNVRARRRRPPAPAQSARPLPLVSAAAGP